MEQLKAEKQKLTDAAEKLMAAAMKAGASSAEVAGSYAINTKITLEKQDFHLASSDDGYNLGLRVLCGKQQGFASGNTTDPSELKELATRAVQIAKFSPENPYYTIEATENVPKEAPQAGWDPALLELSLQTQKDWTRVLADESMRDKRFRVNEGSVTNSAQMFLVMNSLGTHKVEKETNLYWGMMGMGVDGENITSFDYFQSLSRKVSGLPEKIRSTTNKFCNEVLANLKNGPATNYRGTVVFSPRGVTEVFISAILHHLNGRNVVESTSRWKIADRGKKVLNAKISFTDNPWLTDRTAMSIFDREGTPTRILKLIEKGTIGEFFMDRYGAKALGLKSTGNAKGATGAVPMSGAHCVVVGGGDEPLPALLKRVANHQKDFLMVHRFSGQVDPVTGDFSGVAKGGEWWRGGERAYYVKETLISGNVFDVLGDALFGISKETEIVDCAEEAPTIVVDNVSVTSSGTK